MATQTTPQDDAGLQGKVGSGSAGPRAEGRGALEPRSAPVLIEHAVRRGEGQLRRHGTVLRGHRAAHRPLAE